MKPIILNIIFIILLIDSVFANIAAWFCGKKWYTDHFRVISRYFPMTRGWTTYYFALVIFIGIILLQAGSF